MSILSQVLPSIGGGLTGGIYNALGGYAKDISGAAIPTFRNGFVYGALCGMTSKIIYARVEQIKNHYSDYFDSTEARAAAHVAGCFFMIVASHVVRQLGNSYLDLEISKRTMIVKGICDVVVSVPTVLIWTWTSEPENQLPRF